MMAWIVMFGYDRSVELKSWRFVSKNRLVLGYVLGRPSVHAIVVASASVSYSWQDWNQTLQQFVTLYCILFATELFLLYVAPISFYFKYGKVYERYFPILSEMTLGIRLSDLLRNNLVALHQFECFRFKFSQDDILHSIKNITVDIDQSYVRSALLVIILMVFGRVKKSVSSNNNDQQKHEMVANNIQYKVTNCCNV